MQAERQMWKDKMLRLTEKHRYLHNQSSINIETDVVYCRPYYCEMAHNYDLQQQYWTMKPHDLARMAHNEEFSAMNKVWTINFLSDWTGAMIGPKALDLCGGMARCSSIYAHMFDTVDILDL